MKILRTPDERFACLRGYAFAAHYVVVPDPDTDAATLRLHHLDEGPARAGKAVVHLQGEPGWLYLYRKMVPPLTGAGYCVVAPDLIASEGPTSRRRARTTRTPATSNGCARRRSTGSTCGT